MISDSISIPDFSDFRFDSIFYSRILDSLMSKISETRKQFIHVWM